MIELDEFRDITIANNILEGKYIGFYTREFYCFDNFSAFIFEYEGRMFPTIEHAYQAYKFKDTSPEIFEEIASSYSPGVAKTIAHKHEDKVVSNWHNVKVGLMESLLRAKLAQNPYVKKKLLATKDSLICEDSPTDSFWGIGADGKGENMLGKLWMKLREELIVEIE